MSDIIFCSALTVKGEPCIRTIKRHRTYRPLCKAHANCSRIIPKSGTILDDLAVINSRADSIDEFVLSWKLFINASEISQKSHLKIAIIERLYAYICNNYHYLSMVSGFCSDPSLSMVDLAISIIQRLMKSGNWLSGPLYIERLQRLKRHENKQIVARVNTVLIFDLSKIVGDYLCLIESVYTKLQ